MAARMITLTIDGRPLTVPEGMLVVDAARKVGVDIPVFCYHPKMEPVGMCRMCLVDVGRPVMDRATNQPVREADGSLKIAFGAKLDTACTTSVSDNMVVITNSDKVKQARKEVLEFLLTSHPLDCPICDKGGECPLQNLTLAHGAGQSRFLINEKMHLGKHVPLGELIYLDRERCIQCGRCTRFQHEVVDDPVIGFFHRGRALEIITYSEPGFDSIFSGNTTDICPVGALTTADFRFGARPWEMKQSASLCNHCPVGCNITYNVRREAKTGGRSVIKRVMPRQNESVNEIWICDKGRLGYHYTESEHRLTQPLLRQDGALKPVTWDVALDAVATKMKAAGNNVVTLAGGRLANEDLFNLRQLTGEGAKLLYTHMGGGELTRQVGLGQGTDFGQMGKGTAILVVASDLHEEAPIWWLRVKQAVKRGATLMVVNPRPTRLDKYAKHSIHYAYGQEAATIQSFIPGALPLHTAAEAFAQAENGVVIYGSEGMGLAASTALAQACATLLVETNHTGRANNGLLGVWNSGNLQGGWELGFTPAENLAEKLAGAPVVLVAAADPAGDDPALAEALNKSAFVVVQELFLTETAQLADVVLPVLAYTEREGSYTSGERRVQRFYPAVQPPAGLRTDFAIAAQLGARLGKSIEGRAASLVLNQMAADVPAFAGLTYARLAEVTEQWPEVGRSDLYYGGTGYDNKQGLGVQLTPAAQRGHPLTLPTVRAEAALPVAAGDLLLVPVTKLYDRGSLLLHTRLLHQRLAQPGVWMHPATAASLGLVNGQEADLDVNGTTRLVKITTDETLPQGVGLAPRSLGLPVNEPVQAHLKYP